MSVGSEVYRDPFVAMDDYVSYLIPDWTQAEYALDFSLYNIERRYDYPRFLCYDSHRYQTFSSWNPYLNACRSFRVVIYTDPYYYPAYRYRADRVVYARPIAIRQPQFSFKELARGESAVPLRTARPNAVAVAGPPSSAARSGASRPGSVSGQGGVGVVGGAAVRPIRPNPSTRNRGANATATVRGRPTDAVSGRIRLGATATTRPPTSTGSVRPPTSTGSAVRPGGGGSAAVRRPTSGGSAVRPGGGSSARPPASTGSAVRPGGGGSAARPRPTTGSARPPATTGSARPPASTGSAVKPGGRSTGSARPPVRPGRGGGAGGRGGG